MAQISNKTLEYISGEYGVNTSTQLLDNTIATMSHKMKQKEQKQLGDLRNIQIKQAMAQQAEYEKNAQLRDLNRVVEQKKATHLVNNIERRMELETESMENDFLTSEAAGQDAILDLVIGAADNDAKNSVLEKYGGHLTNSTYQSIVDANWDNASEREATISQVIRDKGFEQQKALQRIKASGAGAGKTPVLTAGSADNITTYLHNEHSMNTDIASGVAEKSVALSSYSRNFGLANATDSMTFAQIMAEELERNPQEYYEDPDAWFDKGKVDMNKLSQKAWAINFGEDAQAAPEAETNAPWRAFGYTDEDWEEIKNRPENAGFSDGSLLDEIRRQQGR